MMSVTPLGIPPTVFEALGIRLAYLFGARAGGRAAAGSAVDVAIVLREPHHLTALCRVVGSLESLVSDALQCEARVIPLNRASVLVRFEAIRPGRVLYAADEAERTRFEARTRKDYEAFCRRREISSRPMRSGLGISAAPPG